jgi:serine/threonine-protein kinase
VSADEPLLNIAGDILDGTDQDWSALESSLTASQREVFAALRTIALVASSNRAIIAPTDESSLLGTMWGHLRVQDVVGRGAFGTVYRAWDVQLDREVALKLLDVDPGTNQIAIDEGRLLAKIRHPNVVTVYGADQIASRVGLWMEFVEGATLERF